MKTIVIIGAGFSGTVLAARLLTMASPEPIEVTLINRSGPQGRGVAYGTRSAKHILNVPAGNMSALSTNPRHFLDYCTRVDALVRPESFVSRQIYGDYLGSLLSAAAQQGGSTRRLVRLETEALRIERMENDSAAPGMQIELSNGSRISADEVVLAVGNFPPRNLPVADASFYESARYVRDPWKPGALDSIPVDADVLLLGTGLTAVDVAAQLAQASTSRKCYAISRRGLVPQPHRCARGANRAGNPIDLVDAMGDDVRRYVRVLRAHIRTSTENGVNWRDVLASLRPHTPALWERLSISERKRFLRHVQPFWDVHRHRLAPEAHLYFHGVINSRNLELLRGRVLNYRSAQGEVDVLIKLRGEVKPKRIRVSYVVNCTGPASDVRSIDDPLIAQLLKEGLVCADPLGLGLHIGEGYQCVDASGRVSGGLRYVGPLLKARFWEATAVPELRVHTEALARLLLGDHDAAA